MTGSHDSDEAGVHLAKVRPITHCEQGSLSCTVSEIVTVVVRDSSWFPVATGTRGTRTKITCVDMLPNASHLLIMEGGVMNHAARERYPGTASTVAVAVLGAVSPRGSTPDPTARTSAGSTDEPGVAVILDCRDVIEARGMLDPPETCDAHACAHACHLFPGGQPPRKRGTGAYRVGHGELPSPAGDSPSGDGAVSVPLVRIAWGRRVEG